MADKSIGALWVKEKMMSGNIEIDGKKISIVVFKNTYKKEGEKTPDYKIFLSREQGFSEPKGKHNDTSGNSQNDISEVEPF